MSVEIGLLTNKYKVRRLTKEDINAILELERSNTLYYQWCPPLATEQEILEDMEVVAPGKSKADKYYVGFFQTGKLIAVMDLIDGYPKKRIAFIGFFMVDRSVQGNGIGTEMIQDLCTYLSKSDYFSVQLAWVKGNPQAEHFWLKNHFKKIKETKSDRADQVILAERKLAQE